MLEIKPEFDCGKAEIVRHPEDIAHLVKIGDLFTCDTEDCDCLLEVQEIRLDKGYFRMKSYSKHHSDGTRKIGYFEDYCWQRKGTIVSSPLLSFLRQASTDET